MKTIHLQFRKSNRWLLLLVWCLLLLAGQVKGQIYTSGLGLRYYDVTTGTWTTKAAPPEALFGLTLYQGKPYGHSYTTENFYLYDPATNTWTAETPSPLKDGRLVTAGNYIYAIFQTSSVFARYDPSTDTWAYLADVITNAAYSVTTLTYDGGDYIYCGYAGNILSRYSISGNTWTAMPTPPTATNGLAFKNGKLYFVASTTQTLYSFNPITLTYTQLANPAGANYSLVNGDGNYLYSLDVSGNFYRYDISTNTWTTNTGPGGGYFALTTSLGSCSPTALATATPATCAASGGANTNASLIVNSYGGGVTKVGYSTGSSYAGPDFSAATAVTTAPMTLVNNLVNPTVPQPYTIRAFQDATCYKDVVVTLTPTLCLTSDLRLSLSPVTQTGTKGEMLTYTLTLTNDGPDSAANVKIDVKIPSNTTLLTASPQVGTYSAATQKWDISNLPVGSKTLIVTLKMN